MDKAWVKQLRSLFPAAQKTAFFDIAYENCGSAAVHEASEQYFQDKANLYSGMVKAGGSGKGKTIDVMARTREKLARFLGAKSEKNIAFTANTCQAVSLALQGLSFAPGQHILVGDIEHVSVLMPCLHMRQRGVECKIVRSEDGLSITAEQLLDNIDENTRVVAVSYVQSCSGYQIDLKKLVDGCHAKGVLVLTDAIQALGLQKIDVQELGVDALAASGYKGMLATEGQGFLYCGDDYLAQLQPALAGANPVLTLDRQSMTIQCKDPLDARKLEAGTIPFQSIYGLEAGLDCLMSVGLEEIERHVSLCYETVYHGLEKLGYRLATPFDAQHRCNSMLLCTDNNRALQQFFQDNGVFFSVGKDGYCRISIAPYTAQEDIARLLEVAALWKQQ